MKKIAFLSLILALALVFTGCDFFRKTPEKTTANAESVTETETETETEKETETETYPDPTYGLVYELNDGGRSYYVADIHAAIDTAIVIAAEYRELPVTSISEAAFSDYVTMTNDTVITNITFEGSMDEWRALEQNSPEDWDVDIGDYTVICTDGTIDKDGVPVPHA